MSFINRNAFKKINSSTFTKAYPELVKQIEGNLRYKILTKVELFKNFPDFPDFPSLNDRPLEQIKRRIISQLKENMI